MLRTLFRPSKTSILPTGLSNWSNLICMHEKSIHNNIKKCDELKVTILTNTWLDITFCIFLVSTITILPAKIWTRVIAITSPRFYATVTWHGTLWPIVPFWPLTMNWTLEIEYFRIHYMTHYKQTKTNK